MPAEQHNKGMVQPNVLKFTYVKDLLAIHIGMEVYGQRNSSHLGQRHYLQHQIHAIRCLVKDYLEVSHEHGKLDLTVGPLAIKSRSSPSKEPLKDRVLLTSYNKRTSLL